MRVRHRLSKLLLRQGRVYSGGQAWTGLHEIWLRRQRFDDVHTASAFEHHFDAVLNATTARDRLDEQIVAVAASPRWADAVDRLGCLRGISALTGLALTVEIGDWSRFTGASIGAYVGLVPCEYSSGASRVQGSITKAGNAHVRRLLIEAAWHHRAAYRNPLFTGQIRRTGISGNAGSSQTSCIVCPSSGAETESPGNTRSAGTP